MQETADDASGHTLSLGSLAENVSLPSPDASSENQADRFYVVENCGIKTNGVLKLVFAVQGRPIAAHDDVIRYAVGASQSRAFKALFKKRDTANTVLLLLQHITKLSGKTGLQPAPHTILRPHFACVDPFSDKGYDHLQLGFNPWRRCHDGLPETKEDSFYAEGTAYIFLCPSFFRLMPEPKPSECPSVVGNQFRGAQGRLAGGQVYNLVYDLVRFYLGRNALDNESTPRQRLNWNQCVSDLNNVESVVNPTNLELYIACMSSPLERPDGLKASVIPLTVCDQM